MNNEVLKAIAGRRSVRRFRPGQVREEELAAIVEAGLQAPSGHNDQSCYLVAVQDRALLREMSDGSKEAMRQLPVEWIADLGRVENYDIYYGAPTVVVAAARADAVSPVPDVCAAIENMLLAAESLGIGSCWIGFARFYFNGPERLRRLGIPEGYDVHYAVALGYKPDGLQLARPERKFARYFHIVR